MKRQFLVAVAAVCISAAGVNGQDIPFSYYLDLPRQTTTTVTLDVGSKGLVITDIVLLYLDETLVRILEFDGTSETTRFNAGMAGGNGQNSNRFATGIVITPNVELRVRTSLEQRITLMGYIPDPTQGAGVPAVGSFGFGITVLLALCAGTMLFRRKRQPLLS